MGSVGNGSFYSFKEVGISFISIYKSLSSWITYLIYWDHRICSLYNPARFEQYSEFGNPAEQKLKGERALKQGVQNLHGINGLREFYSLHNSDVGQKT